MPNDVARNNYPSNTSLDDIVEEPATTATANDATKQSSVAMATVDVNNAAVDSGSTNDNATQLQAEDGNRNVQAINDNDNKNANNCNTHL